MRKLRATLLSARNAMLLTQKIVTHGIPLSRCREAHGAIIEDHNQTVSQVLNALAQEGKLRYSVANNGDRLYYAPNNPHDEAAVTRIFRERMTRVNQRADSYKD